MNHKLKVFIAGSKALESERSTVRNVLMQFQTRWDIMIEARSFEDFGYSLTKDGRQTDYNEYITKEADLLIFLYASKVGNITMSEFMLGYSTFIKEGRPDILVFVEQNRNNIPEVEVLKQTMTNLNQYYMEYNSLDELKVDLSEELTKFISEHKEFLTPKENAQSVSDSNPVNDFPNASPQELFNKGYDYYTNSDFKQAYPLIHRSAQFGNPYAQFILGVMYENGQGVETNYPEAFQWFMKAANQGVEEAQNNVGFMYFNGLGVGHNPTEAVKWYRKAAEQGNVEAQNNMGVMCHSGNGTPQDDTEAVKWFIKAAEKGHAGAQCNLGFLYSNGTGVEKDNLEAIKWFKRAAAQGNVMSQRNLGFIYQTGLGIPIDKEESVKWYRLAAQQGDRPSMAALRDLGYPIN